MSAQSNKTESQKVVQLMAAASATSPAPGRKASTCKLATLEEIRNYGHVLTPGRFLGADPQESGGAEV